MIGIDHIAVGSDFGGIITGTVDELSSVSEIPSLMRELRKASYTEGEIEKIFYSNARRVITEHLN